VKILEKVLGGYFFDSGCMCVCVCVLESMVQMGYDREQIEQSLEMERYDEIWAAYHLLSLPVSAVSFFADCIIIIILVIIYNVSRGKMRPKCFFL